jgi:hypothetical protein
MTYSMNIKYGKNKTLFAAGFLLIPGVGAGCPSPLPQTRLSSCASGPGWGFNPHGVEQAFRPAVKLIKKSALAAGAPDPSCLETKDAPRCMDTPPPIGFDTQNDGNDDNDRAIINGRVAGPQLH